MGSAVYSIGYSSKSLLRLPLTQHFFSFFPQFTREPLNDSAWGDGFTDWKLIDALPEEQRASFTPAIGYYDPTADGYIARLTAQLAGLPMQGAGVMVYHYYFDGTYVLSGFEERLLRAPSGPPFFFCWANETWTKRWVGQPNDIIVEQKHLPDPERIAAHAQYLVRFFRLPNYHRLGGRPLLLIYNSQASESLAESLRIYRREFARHGFEPLIGACIGYPQPSVWLTGYDFACEFEPRFFFNTRASTRLAEVGARLKASFPRLFEWLGSQRDRLRASSGNRVFTYEQYLDALASGRIETDLRVSSGGLPLMRSTFLGWDNTPRYRQSSTIVSSEGLHERSFDGLKTLRSDSGLPLMVNSWNEWSEGAAIEPAVRAHAWRDQFLDALAAGSARSPHREASR